MAAAAPEGTEGSSKRARRAAPQPLPLLSSLPAELIREQVGPFLGVRPSALLRGVSRQFAQSLPSHCMDPEPLFTVTLTLGDEKDIPVGTFQWSLLRPILEKIESRELFRVLEIEPPGRGRPRRAPRVNFQLILMNELQLVQNTRFTHILFYLSDAEFRNPGRKFRFMLNGDAHSIDDILRDLCILAENYYVEIRARAARLLEAQYAHENLPGGPLSIVSDLLFRRPDVLDRIEAFD
jgi:hypothetical protein